jgi:dihydrofolate reductase
LGTDQNIWVVGGNAILAPLLDQDLVDRITVQIAPVLLGAGIPLFAQTESLRRFRLEDVKRYGQFAELTCVKP